MLREVSYKSVSYVGPVSSEQVGTPLDLDDIGFTLIEGRLVPNTFLDAVFFNLLHKKYEYGFVLNTRHMFSEEFLDSLDPEQDAVLDHCVLLLIQRGSIKITVGPQR